jgi:3-methylcrotonyl-CoA carboxylase beta subunit
MNIDYNRNEDVMKMSLNHVNKLLATIAEGGGKKAMQKQKDRNKLTARERIEYLVDKDTKFIEIGAFAGVWRLSSRWYSRWHRIRKRQAMCNCG